jgi:nucleotide-binding universal stress UspA family protein
MEPLTSILVDVDATAPAQPALERAVRLALNVGAKLTIADVMTGPAGTRDQLPPAIEEVVTAARRSQLERLAMGVRGVATESRLLTGRPATALIQEVLRSHHDLLMRSHARDLTAPGPSSFGAVDMELLRKCPCPVLLVRHGSPAPQPRIVAAIDISSEDSEVHALNRKLVEAMLKLSSSLGARSAGLLHVWAPFAERTVRGYVSDDQFGDYAERARQRAATDITRFVQSFDGRLDDSPVTLLRGAPEDVIPGFVVSDGVDIVVMGTVARGGLAGMLMGNTAERILRKLPCSVLTIKPDGFVSPVRLDPS